MAKVDDTIFYIYSKMPFLSYVLCQFLKFFIVSLLPFSSHEQRIHRTNITVKSNVVTFTLIYPHYVNVSPTFFC